MRLHHKSPVTQKDKGGRDVTNDQVASPQKKVSKHIQPISDIVDTFMKGRGKLKLFSRSTGQALQIDGEVSHLR